MNLAPDRGPRGTQRGASSLESRLFERGYLFDFFQAVRILHRLDPGRVATGRGGPPRREVVRFRSRVSLAFPPSAIYEIDRPSADRPVPVLTQAFLGLTGINGPLPRHYTELILRLERDVKGPERSALRDWLDLFNHRFVSLFYRAWEKYRFYLPYERGEASLATPDSFTTAVFSLIGLGVPALRGRLRVGVPDVEDDPPTGGRTLARVEDLALLHYGGLLAHRPRCALGLEAIVGDYFGVPSEVRQFQGQWLPLAPENQTRLGEDARNNELGLSAVAGERVWDVQTKFRVRLGPLTYARFLEFLPDVSPVAERKSFFLLVHLVRLYAGPELDFDVQLILRGPDVPECHLAEDDAAVGARLGWNTWLRTEPLEGGADDAVFEGIEVSWVERGSDAVG